MPTTLVEAFFRGLDDVQHGRTVSAASTIAEGRRRIAEYRAKNITDGVSKKIPPTDLICHALGCSAKAVSGWFLADGKPIQACERHTPDFEKAKLC